MIFLKSLPFQITLSASFRQSRDSFLHLILKNESRSSHTPNDPLLFPRILVHFLPLILEQQIPELFQF
jgi:hypothetical protein